MLKAGEKMKKANYSNFIIYLIFILTVIFCVNFCSDAKSSNSDEKDYFQIERRKLLKTKGEIKSTGDAIMQYVISTGKAPDISEITELKNMNFPYFSRLGNLNDAWGNRILYFRDEDDESTFFIASGGKDGVFEGWDQNGRYNITDFKHYNKDIIYSNGGFLYTSN